MTILMTSHDLTDVERVADRIAIIDRGQIVARGTPDELKAEIGRPTLEVVPAETGERERVQRVLTQFGV